MYLNEDVTKTAVRSYASYFNLGPKRIKSKVESHSYENKYDGTTLRPQPFLMERLHLRGKERQTYSASEDCYEALPSQLFVSPSYFSQIRGKASRMDGRTDQWIVLLKRCQFTYKDCAHFLLRRIEEEIRFIGLLDVGPSL